MHFRGRHLEGIRHTAISSIEKQFNANFHLNCQYNRRNYKSIFRYFPLCRLRSSRLFIHLQGQPADEIIVNSQSRGFLQGPSWVRLFWNIWIFRWTTFKRFYVFALHRNQLGCPHAISGSGVQEINKPEVGTSFKEFELVCGIKFTSWSLADGMLCCFAFIMVYVLLRNYKFYSALLGSVFKFAVLREKSSICALSEQ